MTGYQDYLMIISPPDHIKKQVSRYKRASVNIIGQFKGMHSIAHITITNQHRCKPFLAQPAILQMEKQLSSLHPVELQIKGFNFFKHGTTSMTIYAVIEPTGLNAGWFKLLKKQMGIKVKNFVPHITIVKNIPPSVFYKLWPYFEKSTFTEIFRAESLTILHRDTFAEYVEWRVYRELYFGNRLMAF
jgi:2'-5' RNA ligase